MIRYTLLFMVVLMACLGCGQRLSTARMEQDVRDFCIEKYKASLLGAKEAEDRRISKLEKLYSPEQRAAKHIKPLFDRQDSNQLLASYIAQMDTLEITGAHQDGKMLRVTAEFLNEYGSRFELTCSYKRMPQGWEFTKAVDKRTVSLSAEEKRAYLRTNILLAIDKFRDEHQRLPETLDELVPKYLPKLLAGDWDYDPETGELKVAYGALEGT
jgi:hypothetical protein